MYTGSPTGQWLQRDDLVIQLAAAATDNIIQSSIPNFNPKTSKMSAQAKTQEIVGLDPDAQHQAEQVQVTVFINHKMKR